MKKINKFCKCNRPKISVRTHFLTDTENEYHRKIIYKHCRVCNTRHLKYTALDAVGKKQPKDFRGEEARKKYNAYESYIIKGKKEDRQYKPDTSIGYRYIDGKEFELHEFVNIDTGASKVEMATPVRKLSNDHKDGKFLSEVISV